MTPRPTNGRTGTPRTVDGYEADWFTAEVGGTLVGHWVYAPTLGTSGPPVIVIHEATGLTRKTLGIAARIRQAGMTPILPVLAGQALQGRLEGLLSFAEVCIKHEFGALARGEATPTAEWLRALARREARQSHDLPVGVIGMCFSGGYALAMALEGSIKAVVSSQPAFPFAVGVRRKRFGVDPSNYVTLREATDDGACVRVLRYQRDFLSPGERHEALRRVLPRSDRIQVGTWNPLDHPVLTDGLSRPPTSLLGKALADSVEFLRQRLVAPT
jgi:dienelactone hydrolase